MFKSSFKLAMRNLLKRKTSSAINVISLSVGFAAAVLALVYCKSELSFDKGFENNQDIYRVTSSFKNGGSAPTTALPYFKYLKSEIPEIEDVSRLDAPGVSIITPADNAGSTPISVTNGYWADPAFFDIFSFHFLYGSRKTAFSEPNTIVLSQQLAVKLFGSHYPIGKTLKSGNNVYKVSGVFKDDFSNHFKADFLASNNSTAVRERLAGVTNWVIDPNYYTYIKLKPHSNLQHVLTGLNAYTTRHALADMKASGNFMTNALQPLLNIHLHSAAYQSFLEAQQGNIKYLYVLVSIAAFILLLGCINYINLTTAQAIDRAKEVAVRRVMGAGKASIRVQFLMETIIISITALVTGCILATLVLPLFNRLSGQKLTILTNESFGITGWLLLLAVLTGLLAGLSPAFYLSSFKPVVVLKGKLADKLSTFSIRKVLIVLQFAVSSCLIFMTLVMWDQLYFLINTKPGFDQDQQLVINLNSDQARANSGYLISQLQQNSNFKSVTGAGGALVSGDMGLYLSGKTVNDKQDISLNLADENYTSTIGLHLIAGQGFSPVAFTNKNILADQEAIDIGRQVILNEEAVKVLGLDVYTAPGKQLSHLHNSVVYNYTITGVVKNYNYFSLHTAIGPLAIMPVNPIRFNTIIAKFNGNNAGKAIKSAQQKWKQLNPDTPFSYSFLDKLFGYDYATDQQQQQIVSSFAVIALSISCLGLLGLITYSLTQKAKEIGIRKVIGANVSNIVMHFSMQYLKMVLVANLVALPLGWYVMNTWLHDFPYRVTIGWVAFTVSFLSVAVIAFITIGFKIVKAAMANPVNSLRTE